MCYPVERPTVQRIELFEQHQFLFGEGDDLGTEIEQSSPILLSEDYLWEDIVDFTNRIEDEFSDLSDYTLDLDDYYVE